MGTAAIRLKSFRASLEPKVSIRGMADMLGLPHSTYAAYEDPKKFKKAVLPSDLTVKMAEELSDRGYDIDELLEIGGFKSFPQVAEEANRDPAASRLVVRAAVAAGVWREHIEWPEDQWDAVEVPPSPVAGVERFALRMEGRSMEKTILPEADLECIRVTFGEIEPQPGDVVIIERHQHGLAEMTCKRLARDGDEWVALPETTVPELSDPIRLGRPSPDLYTDDECRIVGIVIRAHKRLWSPPT